VGRGGGGGWGADGGLCMHLRAELVQAGFSSFSSRSENAPAPPRRPLLPNPLTSLFPTFYHG
jgi:hypothetical protein